ncbi:MAG: hypothetical protein WAX04_09630 [Oscillospiraceae bacterium]
MSKKTGTGVNIGSVSILVIFVLLCLTTFATLSLVSANADAKLTDSAAKSLSEFYLADSQAEELLSSIDLKLIATTTSDKSSYFKSCIDSLSALSGVTTYENSDGIVVDYSVPVNDNRKLCVSLNLLYPNEANGKRFRLEKWQTVYTGEWEADDSLNLWDSDETIDLPK